MTPEDADKARNLAVSYAAYSNAIRRPLGPERDEDLACWGSILAKDAEAVGIWATDIPSWLAVAAEAKARMRQRNGVKDTVRSMFAAAVEETKP